MQNSFLKPLNFIFNQIIQFINCGVYQNDFENFRLKLKHHEISNLIPIFCSYYDSIN